MKDYLIYVRVFLVISSLVQGKESEAVGLDDFFSSSPKSPLSPEKPHQARESNRDCTHSCY